MYPWKDYLLPLYDKVKPTGGIIYHGFTNRYPAYKGSLDWMQIIMHCEPFDFKDPMIGHQTGVLGLEFSTENMEVIKSNSLFNLQNQTFKPKVGNATGTLSNSIFLTIHEIGFGKVVGKKIPLKIICSFINSTAGYAYLDGTIEDHSEYKITYEFESEINEFATFENFKKKNEPLKTMKRYVDANHYDLDNAIKTDKLVSYQGYSTQTNIDLFQIFLKYNNAHNIAPSVNGLLLSDEKNISNKNLLRRLKSIISRK